METLKLETEKKQKNNFYIIAINVLTILSILSYMMCLYKNFSWLSIPDWLLKIFLLTFVGIVLFVFLFKYNKLFVIRSFYNKNIFYYIFSILSTAVVISFIIEFSKLNTYELVIFSILSSFCIFLFFLKTYQYTIPKIIGFFKNINKEEKIFLIVGISIYCVLLIIANLSTKMFVGFPAGDNMWYEVFSLDTSFLYSWQTFVNPFEWTNNIKHLLISYVIMPFTILPYQLLVLLNLKLVFYILFQIAQIIMVMVIIIYLKRLLKLENIFVITSFYLIATISSTFLLNALLNEKFVVLGLFLILTINAIINKDDSKYYYFFMTLASLSITFLLFIPVFFEKGKKLTSILKCIISFAFIELICVFVSGNAICLFNFYDEVNGVLSGYGSVGTPFYIQLIMYITLLARMFLIPEMTIKNEINIWETQATINSYYFWIGIIILIVSVLGFILNKKDKFIQICFYWFIIVTIYTAIVGWGVAANEMFISSMAYFWAILPLMFSFITSIAKKPLNILISSTTIFTVILIINSIQFVQLISLSHQLFPMF